MEINLDDLQRILTDGRLAVSLAGATCIHCSVVSRTIESAAEHDASCEKHPMAARLAALEAALAEAREDSKRRRVALEEVLDGLGALTKPHELDGCGIGIKRALEIIALSKERP